MPSDAYFASVPPTPSDSSSGCASTASSLGVRMGSRRVQSPLSAAVWQGEDEQRVAAARPANLGSELRRDERRPAAAAVTGGHGDVLPAVHGIRDREALCGLRQTRLPENRTTRGVVGVHVAVPVAAEHESA